MGVPELGSGSVSARAPETPLGPVGAAAAVSGTDAGGARVIAADCLADRPLFTPDGAALLTSTRRRVRSGLGWLLTGRGWTRARTIADLVALGMALGIDLAAEIPAGGTRSQERLVVAFAVVMVGMLFMRRGPEGRLHYFLLDEVTHVLGVLSLAGIVVLAGDALFDDGRSIGFTGELWVSAVIFVTAARIVLVSLRREVLQDPALQTPTLIIGGGDIAMRLAGRLLGDPGHGLRPVGLLDTNPMPSVAEFGSLPVPVLGGPEVLAEAAERTGARHVIFAFASDPDHLLADEIRECAELGLELSVVPRLYETVNHRSTLDHIGGLPVLVVRPTDPQSWEFAVKHGLDRVIAFFALVALAPLMAAIAIAVRLSSPGPALFFQRRIGRDGREFDVVKFRTMRQDRSGQTFTPPPGCAPGGIEGEDRRTRLGRFLRETSLDELPQLINVLRGEMSLVGPRPERPEYVERFSRDVNRYADRHRVKSGVTGWAQVNGLRGQTSIADRVEWDNYYIQNWSLRFDLRILMLTLADVLRVRPRPFR